MKFAASVALSAVCLLVALAAPTPASAAVCANYPNQAAAQRAADTRDGDGDGVYCEDLPCPCLRPGQGQTPSTGSTGAGSSPSPLKSSQTLRGTVESVVDGDTLHVSAAGRSIKVRLVGIDSPESSSTRYGRPSCGGRQATALARRLAPVGAAVVLTTDPTQDAVDRYGRLLAYVAVRGRSLQVEMLRAGWAKVYVYRSPFQRLSSFRAAAATAVRAHRGIYRSCGGQLQRPL